MLCSCLKVDREYAPSRERELHLIKTLEEKFQVEITEEKLRAAAALRNKQRKNYNELLNWAKWILLQSRAIMSTR